MSEFSIDGDDLHGVSPNRESCRAHRDNKDLTTRRGLREYIIDEDLYLATGSADIRTESEIKRITRVEIEILSSGVDNRDTRWLCWSYIRIGSLTTS